MTDYFKDIQLASAEFCKKQARLTLYTSIVMYVCGVATGVFFSLCF